MKFGDMDVSKAEGAILAHAVRVGDAVYKKGIRLTAEDVNTFLAAGTRRVVAARLEKDDVHEDAAAGRVAAAAEGHHVSTSTPSTGRVNLFADRAGVVLIDRAGVDRLNLLHEGLTLATVPPYTLAAPGMMVATVKVIPFSLPESVVHAGCCSGNGKARLIGVAPLAPRAVGLIQTRLSGSRESVLEKSLGTVRRRVEILQSHLQEEVRCSHAAEPVSKAIGEQLRAGVRTVLLLGASSIADRDDVIPTAIRAAGGRIEHLGMPVDPGNLLLIGSIGDVVVIGLPGCARSPKLNGADWVLRRVLCDVEVTAKDVMLMGVGGLLKEIPERPMPRAEAGRRLKLKPEGA